MLDRLFVRLMDRNRDIMTSSVDAELFDAVKNRLQVSNVAYMGVNLPVKNNREYFVHNTYSNDWAMRYETANYVSIDPVLRLGLTGIMPIDWCEIGSLSKDQRNFFGEAQEFKIGRQGLTFPLKGIFGETAIFSITADFSSKEWHDFKREKLRELRIISDLIHQNVVHENRGIEPRSEVSLTDREKECLKWIAEGKTYQDIADVLGISARTVRFFLEGARYKLQCANSTQSVVVALQLGLI